MKSPLVLPAAVCLCCGLACAEVCNLKVVTDASPDYTDMPSLVRSVTSNWPTPREKVWAMFYWTHLGRRQTAPMMIHGMECADPIRQFNDYGFAMCSTVSGINCAIWHHMGLPVKFIDISCHTVAECFYDDKWHVYDNAFSAIYTHCDGTTVACALDVAKEGACEASGGRKERGHIARYHCLTATSPNGFLTGSDTQRSLASQQGAFTGHQYRYYFCGWDDGHRYILNLREGETYTRVYRSLGADPRYYIPNVGEHPEKPPFDPESVNKFGIRGNGRWTFKPPLTSDYPKNAYSHKNIAVAAPVGLQGAKAGDAAEIVFSVQSANVTTSQTISAVFLRKTVDDAAKISISTTNGLKWKEVWAAQATGEVPAKIDLLQDVSGAYRILVKIELLGKGSADNAVLKNLEIETTTEINAKANPRLNLGKNTIYVGLGDQTESIVCWPDPRPDRYRELLLEENNILCGFDKEWIWYGNLHPKNGKEPAWLVYKIEAPGDITRLTYGGRFSNRYQGCHIDMLYSLDEGKTWKESWSLKSAEQPWDTLHSESVEIPAGHRCVLAKYWMSGGSSIYAVHMEANYKPADTAFVPVEVTCAWNEVQADRKTVRRSHTQLVEKVPCTYTVNVGGADHPVMESLRVNLKGAVADVKYGYSDGRDAGGEKFLHTWRTEGKILTVGKPYTVSVPPKANRDKILTDGVAGPPGAGGASPGFGLEWDAGKTPEITVDLGQPETMGAFRIFITAGWPWWDAFRGEVQDKIELLTSADGAEFKSQGFFNTNIYKKDVPINFMVQDDETARGWNFELVAPQPVKARFVRWKLTTARWLAVTEVQALDFVKYEPFDIRLALP
ncbi:MAG: discoidin domain-containing protein [Planctomycetota bacterium]|nr:discoidin domain-containing protein [Planctomycetota bacterium]